MRSRTQQNITDSKSMAQTSIDNQGQAGDVDQQLQAMAERLGYLLKRLDEQREKCATKKEKKYLTCLRKETKKQLALITKLQDSVEDTMTIMAKSSQALDNPICEKVIGQREHRPVDNANDNLFQAVGGSFQKHYRLVQQMRSIDLSKKLKLWQTARPVPRQAPLAGSEASNSSATTLEQYSGPTSNAGDLSVQASDHQSTPSPEHTDPESSSEGSETASVAPSDCSSPRISVQDWSILTPPEGLPTPPPLPRKSSRRMSYTPRVPSVTSMPPLPTMPTSPPPSVPDADKPDSANSDEEGASSSIVSNLEKRYSLTIATPPATP